VVLKFRWNFQEALDIIVYQGGDDGLGYRNMCKNSWGVETKSVLLICISVPLFQVRSPGYFQNIFL
jgi:hypothetical protein